jgi:hypothetical protein
MNTNFQASQLLIISSSQRRFDLRGAVHNCLDTPVSVVADFQEAVGAISVSRYRAVVLDEGLADLNPAAADQFLARCTDELPIFVKLAISGIPRCVQQIQLAMRRFDREQQIAAAAVQRYVDSQMRDALTSIFLYGQLTLKVPGLPEDAVKHLDAILEAGEVLKKTIGARLD